MNIETIIHYINIYGYFVIFLFLFFGIVGIPAPEESLLFLIGVLITHHQLSFPLSFISAFLGAITGMLTAFVCGKYMGHPFINRFGKYVGITEERWEKAQSKYTHNMKKTIIFGFYMPGIRQISPYFAGITKVPFQQFLLLSMFGAFLWTVPFILAGYFLGKAFHINPVYVPYLGILFLVIFFLYVFIKHLKNR